MHLKLKIKSYQNQFKPIKLTAGESYIYTHMYVCKNPVITDPFMSYCLATTPPPKINLNSCIMRWSCGKIYLEELVYQSEQSTTYTLITAATSALQCWTKYSEGMKGKQTQPFSWLLSVCGSSNKFSTLLLKQRKKFYRHLGYNNSRIYDLCCYG